MDDGHPLAVSAVAGYRVEALIGRGGMGEVYRAIDDRLGRPVALKVIAGGVTTDEGARRRLLEESRLAASLDHPNVVPVYEVGESEGRLFLAMRYVAGIDLRALLHREGAIGPERAVAVAAQIADALDAAHRRGLVHRDVKPSNVLLDHADGREHAYLADFGLTQSTSATGPADGQFMGTVDYVAPEQIRGDAVDGRADEYGLACLLFECLTGTVPYRTGSGVGALFAHLEEPVPSAAERRVGLPPAVDDVFARALAKEPEARYATCTGFVAAARGALGIDVPVGRSGRVVAALVASVAVLAAAVVAVVLLRGGGRSAPPAAPTGMLLRVDPRTNTVAARSPVAGHPGNVAVTPGGVWMADFTEGVLWRQARPGAPVERITSNGEPRDLAAMGDKVYVATDGKAFSGVVSRYDAVTGIREETLDQLTCAMASGGGVVWAAGCPAVERIRTGDGKLRTLAETVLPYAAPATVENVRAQIREMAVGAGALWVLGDARDRRVWRLDARTGRVLATIALDFPPRSVAVAGGAAWITDGLHDTVVPVDVRTNRAGAPLRVGRGAAGIAADGTTVWVANQLDGTVSRVDARSRRMVATVRTGGAPRELAVGHGSVWVAGDAR
jgi:YVTN family beta-propeller protein